MLIFRKDVIGTILKNVPMHEHGKQSFVTAKYSRRERDANETRNDLSLAGRKAARQVEREMIFLYYWGSSGNHTLPLPVTRGTRDSILGIKGKLKVVLSHLKFYLIHAARRIRKNSLRVDPTGKLIKIWILIAEKQNYFLLSITIAWMRMGSLFMSFHLCIDKITRWTIVACNEKNHWFYLSSSSLF